MIFLLILVVALGSTAFGEPVRFTHTELEVPTYAFGRSDTVAPLFKSLENMGHYPYTILDWESRTREPIPVKYDCLELENEYLRVQFLPELGGRIFSAYDKVAKRDIFYRPTVIKPGRYNQRGGWPVGNLELYGPYDAHMLTWPGEPWPWAVVRDPDGSATVVLSHIDHIFRDKISLSVTLRPGQAFVETTLRLYNRNLLPNRYLMWTNAGVGVTEGSRFVYPMTRTIGHDSSALGTWPMINGQDLSWNKNNQNMLGVFGLDIYDNFMSIYDYKTDYGTICFTNRLLARGMKTWTFGSGPTALRHMAIYTDNDGLYMETQSGRFIWDGNYEFIDPGKTDGWTEYWYGAGQLGGLTTATKDVAVNLVLPKNGEAGTLAITATRTIALVSIEIRRSLSHPTFEATADLNVGSPFRASIPYSPVLADRSYPINLVIRSSAGQVLLDYTIYPEGSPNPNSEYASDSVPRKWNSEESLTVEELYQKGLSSEKFGQIALAEEAYAAALKKDPLFSPVHLRLGLLAMERFQDDEAAAHFEKVLERDPTNGDAHYFLGVIFLKKDPSLTMLSLNKNPSLEARRHFYRLLPSSSKFDRRDYMLGLVALKDNNFADAMTLLSHARAAAPLDLAVRQALAYILRSTGRRAEAERECHEILVLDPTSAFARMEALQAMQDQPGSADRAALDLACAHHPQGYIELATEYMRLSAWKEAAAVVDRGINGGTRDGKQPDPLLWYYRAYLSTKNGDSQTANEALLQVRAQQLALEIFPFRAEDVTVLQSALVKQPLDVNAAVLLGDLLYSRERRDEAMKLWREAVEADRNHFFALRDLGLALVVGGSQAEGLGYLTRAAEQRPEHLPTTVLLADMNARLGHADAARQAILRSLEKSPGRDILVQKLATLEAQLGNGQKALETLAAHTFEATHQSYSLLHLYRGVRLQLALDAYKKQRYDDAIAEAQAATEAPANLGIDDFAKVPSSRLLVFRALLQEAKGDLAAARAAWTSAAETRDDDIEGEGLFRAIALAKTGQEDRAREWLDNFRTINRQRKTDNSEEVRIQAYYLAGMESAFRGERAEAADSFRAALAIDESHLYSRQALAWLDAGLLDRLNHEGHEAKKH